ncbi:hypothetical protein DFQ26_001466 [Actinomortierella ambigua]|nr:hypothetical protein DFQ26_001466 [Actinomortierella ambigua]
MRPQSSVVLPVECIQEIVSHCHDCTTLFALLTVSKAVSGIAARKLYADPFAMVHERQHAGGSSSGSRANNNSSSKASTKSKKGGDMAASPIFSLIQRILEDSPANDPLTNCLRAACYQRMSHPSPLPSPLVPSQASSAPPDAQADLSQNGQDEIQGPVGERSEHEKKPRGKVKPWKLARKPGSSAPFMEYLTYIRHITCSYSMLEQLSTTESIRLCMPILSDQMAVIGSPASGFAPPVVSTLNHTTSNSTTASMTSSTSPDSTSAAQGSNEYGNSHHDSVFSIFPRYEHEEDGGDGDGEEDEEEEDLGAEDDDEDDVMSSRYRIGKDKAFGQLLEHLAWAICGHQPQNIKTLHLPTEHLVRFKSQLSKLTSLETVVIDIKRALLEGEMPERRQGILDFAKDFVTQYGEQRETAVDLDNGIRPVSICSACAASEMSYSPLQRVSRITTSNNNANSPSLKMLLKQIREILPPLNCPRSLTQANWAQFRTKAESTNLAHVRTLEYESRQSPSEQASPFDPDALTWEGSQGDLLKRCRSLRSLKLFVWEKEAFRWAVEEKLRVLQQYQLPNLSSSSGNNNNNNNNNKNKNNNSSGSSSSNINLSTGSLDAVSSSSSLIQLQWAKLSCEADMLRDVMDDFLFAFGHSLQTVNISLSYSGSWSESSRQALLQENHAIGRRWRLSHLTHLSILSRSPLLLAASAFRDCHQLMHMVLYDTLERADPTEIIWQDVWHMPKLVRLKLVGALALAFNPGSLASMGKLKSIVLEGPRVTKGLEEELLVSSVPYPSLGINGEESGSDGSAGAGTSIQSRWAWRSWSLPSLEEMSFRGWPAHGFDLSALFQCPRLQDVLMDCRGYDRHRKIYHSSQETTPTTVVAGSTDDLEAPSSPSLSSAELTSITAKLVRFRLVGPWILSDTIMQQLLVGLEKRLEYLYLSDCQQYAIETLVQCSKRMPRLGYIYCSRSILPQDAQKLGLAPPKDVSTIMPFPGERKAATARQRRQGDAGEGGSEDNSEDDDEHKRGDAEDEQVTHCKLSGCKNPINIETSHGQLIRHAFCSKVHAIRCGEHPARATAQDYVLAKDLTYVPPARDGTTKKSYRQNETAYGSPLTGSMPSTPTLSMTSSPTLSAASSEDGSVATMAPLYEAGAGQYWERQKKEVGMDVSH